MNNMEKPELIKNNVFFDNRGIFAPLSLNTLSKQWIQSNISVNPKKFTLRGLHFQYGKSAQSKLIKVINGKILDFIVDLREYSPTYNNIQFFLMESNDELYVPFDFAHGFITLTDHAEVAYKTSDYYAPQCDSGIIWDDPMIAVDWPISNVKPILSEKDQKLGLLQDFASPFEYDGVPLALLA